MAVGDVIKLRAVCWRAGPHLGVNVTHWISVTETLAGVTVKEFVDAMALVLPNPYKNLLSVNANYRGIGAQKILPTLGAEHVSVVGAGAGTDTGDVLQTQSGLIKKLTAFGGRKYRGRMYVPFPSEARNSATGNPDSTYSTNLAVLASAYDLSQTIVGVGGTATFAQCIYHRATNTVTAMVDQIAEVQWGTQRRRQERGKILPLPF